MAILATQAVRVRTDVEYQGMIIQNVLWYKPTTAILGDQTLAAFAAEWRAGMEAAFISMLPDTATFRSIYVQSIQSVAGAPPLYYAPVEEYTEPINSAGSVIEDGFPPFVTLNTSWRTGLTGRRRRGRNYWGPVPETFAAHGKLNSVGLSAEAALRTALLITLDVGTPPDDTFYRLCIFSRRDLALDTGINPITTFMIPVEFGLPDRTVRRQKRRQYLVGI